MYSTLGKVSAQNSMTSMRLRIRLLITGLLVVVTFGVVLKIMSSSLEQTSREYASRRRLDEHNHETAPEQINLNELFHMGECLLREAGKHIVQIRQQVDLSIDHKKDKSVVTKADLESHTIIVHTLEHKFKRLRVLSEENAQVDDDFDLDHYLTLCDTYQKTDSDLYTSVNNLQVWIDPLDATQEYSENLIDYVTVMFCIVDKNKPKAGIIHNPFKNVTLSSFYSRTRADFNDKGESKKNRIIISRSHAGSVNATIYEKIPQPEIIIAAGSGFKTMSLLNGQADLYLHTSKIYKWDICAPNAIINNHGGRLMVRNGREVDYSDTRKEYLAVDGILAAINNFYYFYDLFKSV